MSRQGWIWSEPAPVAAFTFAPSTVTSGLAVVFTDPQIMLAGQAYAELSTSHAAFETGEASFDDQGRSRVMC